MIKPNQTWYLLYICTIFKTHVNPFFRAVFIEEPIPDLFAISEISGEIENVIAASRDTLISRNSRFKKSRENKVSRNSQT